MKIPNTPEDLIRNGISDIIEHYTETALLINACHIAINRYSSITTMHHLSTTTNIPPGLRLPIEIDVTLSKEELVRRYEGSVQKEAYANFVVFSVTIVDGILEDIYEAYLRKFETSKSEDQIEKDIRNAWTNNTMIQYLTNPETANLKKPEGFETGFEESYNRYLEYRIIRHSLVHSRGSISNKNIKKLEELKLATPKERQKYAIHGSYVIGADSKIVLNVNFVLSARLFLHNYLCYLLESIKQAS